MLDRLGLTPRVDGSRGFLSIGAHHADHSAMSVIESGGIEEICGEDDVTNQVVGEVINNRTPAGRRLSAGFSAQTVQFDRGDRSARMILDDGPTRQIVASAGGDRSGVGNVVDRDGNGASHDVVAVARGDVD